MLVLAALVTACSTGTQVRPVDRGSAELEGYRHVDDLYVVDCLLPGEVRQMGRMTYLTPRRPIKTTAFDCRVRGGEYVAYDRANYQTALRVWQEKAESGDAEAQVIVGEIYEKGLGTAPDYGKAAQWYIKAAEQGNQRALTNLAYLHEQGLGVEQNLVAAINYYRKAAGDAGDDLMFASAARERYEQQQAQLRDELREARSRQAALQRQIEDLQNRLGQQQSQRQEDRDTIAALQGLLDETNARLAEKSQRLDRLESMEVPGVPASREASGADTAAAEAELARREQALARREEALARKEAEFQQEIEARRDALAREQARASEEIESRRAALAREEERMQAQLEDRREALAREESLAEDDVEQRRAALEQEAEQAREDLRAREEALAQEEAQMLAEARERREALAREEARLREEAQEREQALASERAEVQDEARARERELARREAELARWEAALAQREATLEQAETQPRTEVAARDEPPREPEQETPEAPGLKLRQRMDFGGFYALVIGLQDYQYWDKLDSARRDADEIAALLGGKYGFKVQVLHDAGALEIMTAINGLRGRVTEKDNVLIYFAGRGQLRRPVEESVVGYWLPVDAQREMTTLWLPNSQINEQIALLSARSVMVVADSCFAGAMSTDPASLLMGGGVDLNERRVKLGLERRARYTLSSGGLHPVPEPGQSEHSIFASAMIDVLRENDGILNEQALIQQLTGRVTRRAERMGFDQRPELRPIRSVGHLPGGSFFLVPREDQTAGLGSVGSGRAGDGREGARGI